MLKPYYVIIVGFVFLTNVFAADYFFCSGTNNYIYLGASIESVKKNCGEPLSIRTREVIPEQSMEVDEYIYHYQLRAIGLIQETITSQTLGPGYRRVPYGLILEGVDGKIIRIRVDGEEVKETNYCRSNLSLSIGDSVRRAYEICGRPSLKQTKEKKVRQAPVQETTMTYRDSDYLPSMKMIFKDGILVSIER
jgi:hypothetical protein